MSEELEVLKTVSQRLNQAGIPYMITGSTAANFYAVPRMTRDIDIVIDIRKEDAGRISNLFEDEFYVDPETVREAVDRKGMFNIIHNEYVIKIDFIVRKEGPYRELEFKRRREIQVEGVSSWVVSPEDLILSKLVWAKDSFSEMQLRDVKNILTALKGIDLKYIEQWIPSLGLAEVYEKVKK